MVATRGGPTKHTTDILYIKYVSYTLSSRYGLTVKVRARNEMDDGRAAPFMAGCHPYFKLENSDFSTARL